MAKGKRSGLGKGLDSLIPQMIETAPAEAKKKTEKPKTVVVEKPVVVEKEVIVEKPVIVEKYEKLLDINLIEPNRSQPRKQFDREALEELAASISNYGVLQPILVQKKDEHYEIIAGERRWRAAKLAGRKEVPVIIKDYTDRERMEIALIENIQRESLNPIEEAKAYQSLIEEYQLKHEEIAERVSKSRSAITNAMRLLKLDTRVQKLVADGKLSMGHARALLSLENGDLQVEIAVQAVEKALSVREIERLVKIAANPPQKKEKPVPNPSVEAAYLESEKRLEQILGTKVSIQRKDEKKGKIEISYYSLEELERIMDLIGAGGR